MRILVDRDSVAMGDDVESHNREFEVRANLSIGQLFILVKPDASIMGGRATWLVVASTAGLAGSPPNRIPLGVYAQEWGAIRLFGSAITRLDELAPGAEVLHVYFRYFSQVDPGILFDRYLVGGSMSREERNRLTGQRLAQVAESDALRDERSSTVRYLSLTAIEAIEGFGATIALHSPRFLKADLPTRNGPISAIVQTHDTMAGVSMNGRHIANFRPVLHAEQFVVVLLGDAWRIDTGRPPVVLPPGSGHFEVSAVRHGRAWFVTWSEGKFRHNATFGSRQELAERFARIAPLTLPELVTAYRALD